MPLDSNHLTASAVEEALALMDYFKSRRLSPPEAVLVTAAMHASLLVQSQKERRPEATIDAYVESHREAMQLFLDLDDALQRSKPDAPGQ